MKKILLIFGVLMLFMTMTFAQGVPDQIIPGDYKCEGVIPNFIDSVLVTDNCEIASVLQLPAPGTILTSSNQTQQVIIVAEDTFGNTASLYFNVVLTDTIPPTITWVGEPIAMLNNDKETQSGIKSYLVISDNNAQLAEETELFIEYNNY